MAVTLLSSFLFSQAKLIRKLRKPPFFVGTSRFRSMLCLKLHDHREKESGCSYVSNWAMADWFILVNSRSLFASLLTPDLISLADFSTAWVRHFLVAA